jgi:acetyl esterase/lipase
MSWGRMQEGLRAQHTPAPAKIAYGEGANRYGELALPPGPGPHPVAVVLHGGCWLSMADLSYVRPLAQELNRVGWATWTIEFNRIDEAEGAWPGIFQDVALGIDHLRELAADAPLDLERVVVVGHSSGGHLAFWSAARRKLPRGSAGSAPGGEPPLPVKGVIGLAPVAGLEDFQARSDRCGSSIVGRLLGGPPEEVPDGGVDAVLDERLRVADPQRLLPLGVPQLLIMGELDRIVPPSHGIAWRNEAEARGDEVELFVVPNAGHFELLAPWTDPWARVATKLEAFLRIVLEGGA